MCKLMYSIVMNIRQNYSPLLLFVAYFEYYLRCVIRAASVEGALEC